MASTIDQNESHVTTSKSDMGGSLLTAASTLGTAGTIVSSGIAVYEFLKSLEPDPIQEALEQVLDDLKIVMLKQDFDQLSGIKNNKATPLAVKIDAGVDAMKAFNNSESDPNRATLANNLIENGGLHDGLLGLFSGYNLRFIPTLYRVDGKTPKWTKGRYSWCSFYDGWLFSNDLYQVYEQGNQPLAHYWTVPAPLAQDNFERWDAALYLPLYEKALRFWEIALGQLEPFYRLTGQWASHITDVATYMEGFAGQWSNSLLQTREMPSKEEIKQNIGFFFEPNESVYCSGSGFGKWALGVVDPITGIERVNLNWWKADQKDPEDHIVELWTEEQRTKFLSQRALERQTLAVECGLFGFKLRAASVRALLIPPSYSPSMQPHPELLHSQYVSSGTDLVIAHAEQTQVVDKLGNQWLGNYARTPVIVTAPFSIQSNPDPGQGRPRRAQSDVELGYQIRVTPKGGETQQNPDWIWYLRHHRDDPVSSLYHTQDGELRVTPYSISKKFPVSKNSPVKAETWETITDGTKRDQRDIKLDSSIAFTMTVTVADMAPVEGTQPKLITEDVEKRTRRGALWIKIEADKDENLGRSFELNVELTETAAVDPEGNTEKPADENKKYKSTLTIPVDICRIYVAPAYFGSIFKGLGWLQTDSRDLKIPGPEPDPDPILELSLWRIVLEREPALLQRYVHRRREATWQSTLTAQQALAELDRMLGHAGQALPRVPGGNMPKGSEG
jgi:hypothetical protein